MHFYCVGYTTTLVNVIFHSACGLVEYYIPRIINSDVQHSNVQYSGAPLKWILLGPLLCVRNMKISVYLRLLVYFWWVW